MQKILVIDHEKCTGCRMCEIVCSLKKEGVVNPVHSRINVIRWESVSLNVPVCCQQCESPVCASVCPVEAISCSPWGAVVINYEVCIGCKSCVLSCPFGGVSADPVAKRIVKCDLCQGEPTCVSFCATGALRYVEVSAISINKKRNAAARFLRASGNLREEKTWPYLI